MKKTRTKRELKRFKMVIEQISANNKRLSRLINDDSKLLSRISG